MMLLSPFVQGISASQLAGTTALAEEPVELGIIGDGAVGLAGGYLLTGNTCCLRLYPTNPSARNNQVLAAPPEFIELIGRGQKSGTLDRAHFEHVSRNELESLRKCDGIILAAASTEYGVIIDSLKKYIVSGQTILLLNATLGAGFQFHHALHRAKPDHELNLNILELGTLFDCARVQENVLKVFGPRKKVSICGNSRNETRRALSITSSFSKSLIPTSNVLERGFVELEKTLRPVLLLFGLLGGAHNFSNLGDIVNPQLMAIVRILESEIQSICKSYRVTMKSFLDTLTDLSAIGWEDADCLEQALITVGPTLLAQTGCAEIADRKVGASRALRVLQHDVTSTLTLIEDLARTARLHTPVLSSIIDLSNVVSRADLRKTGLSLTSLGWFGMDVTEITEAINA